MRSSPRRAFTLVELLVVIAIIGVLVGSLAAVLRPSGRAPALQAAQATLSGFVAAARAQAALDNTTSTIVIWSDRDNPETYLRRAAVAVRVDTNNDGLADSYTIKGEPVDLPRGIFFVPQDNNGTNLPAALETPADWSTFTLTESQATSNGTTSAATVGKGFRRYEESSTPQWQPDPDAPVTYYENLAFDAYGKLVSLKVPAGPAPQYLAVAPGEIQTGAASSDRGVIFREVDGLRGVKLNVYGVAIQLNEKSAF